MSNKPITSRIKRSPLLKYSPLKNEDDPKAKVTGTEKGEDKVVTKTEERELPQTTWFKKNCYNADGSRKRGVKGCSWADEQGKESPKETETVTTTTTEPGEDIDFEGKLYAKKEFDVLQPWETRQMSRAIKKEQRDIRRAKKKLERAQKRGNTVKAEEAQAELDEFKAMAERGKAARASGRKTGTSKVYAGQREMDLAELDKGEQKKQVLETARKEARQKAAEAKNITTGTSTQAEQAITPGQQIQQMAASFDPSAYSFDFQAGDYSNLLNKPSALNMKSSPVKKALKGNQYKLPKHLQDAIKAAPGKLKTPLKKGYFKNK